MGCLIRPKTKDFVKIEYKTFLANKYKPTISRNETKGRELASQENID